MRAPKVKDTFVFTSRVRLPYEAANLYGNWEELLALAEQGYFRTRELCSTDDTIPSGKCPTAMTVLAVDNVLYFGSSTKKTQSNWPFYISLISGPNTGVSRQSAAGRLKLAMIQCQTQQQTRPDAHEHNTDAMCGEFTSVFLYLLTHLLSVGDIGGRIITVGTSGSTQTFFPLCRDKGGNYGCRSFVSKLGIEYLIRPPGAAQSRRDLGSVVDNVDFCELDEFGDWGADDGDYDKA